MKKLGSQIYSIVYKYVCFIRLENLVYQNNPIIIIHSDTIAQLLIQHTTLNQLSITKQIFLNIYHFLSTITDTDSFHQS